MFFDYHTLAKWLQTHSFSQLSVGQYGGTFVDWSINYLCDVDQHTVVGNSQHTVVGKNRWRECAIPVNPITANGTAHKHVKNHSGDIGDIIWQWQFLHNYRRDNFHTFYIYMTEAWAFCDLKDSVDMLTSTEYYTVWCHVMTEFFSKEPDVPHILVYPDFDTSSWTWLRQCRTINSIANFSDFNKENHLAPFAVDQTLLKEEIREQVALSSVPYYLVDRQISKKQLQLKELLPNSMSVSVTDIFNDLERVLKELGSRYSVLNFNQTKWDAWREIYASWKNKNVEELNWCKNLNDVTNKIINQQSCKVGNITELQESAIETELLLKGYSIKNFNLKKFPSDLSLLVLEPNVHSQYVNQIVGVAQSSN